MSDNEREKDEQRDEKPDENPDEKVQIGELSRRRFLYIAGVVGVTPIVNGVDPLQLTRTKTQVPKAKVVDKIAVPVQNLTFSTLRPDDLLALDFECINLRVKAGSPPKLVRQNASAPAYIVVHFPPQHIAEQAFFETTPDFKPDPKAAPEPTTSEPPTPPPVLSRISGPSRLAFFVPSDIDEIPLTLESLLSWELFEPSLVAVAIPPRVSGSAATVRGQLQPLAKAAVPSADSA